MENGKLSTAGIKAREKTGDPFIFTRESATGYFSFLNSKKHSFDYARPPPIYMQLGDINEKRSFTREAIDAEFKTEKNGELRLINEDIKERQSGVLKEVFKNMASTLMEGKNVTGLSLPVRIFEPRSHMERMLDDFHFFPHYLKRAAAAKDTEERLVLITSAVVAGLHHCLSQMKPFNPILGETFTGQIDASTNIYLEHINHHPPITAYLVEGDGWKLHGRWLYNAELGPMRTKTFNEGWSTLVFSDGDTYQFNQPAFIIKGLVLGTRTFKVGGSFIVFNPQKKLKAVFKFGEKKKGLLGGIFGGKKSDTAPGQVYRYDPAVHAEALGEKNWLKQMDKMAAMGDATEVLGKLTGTWLKELKYKDKLYWSMDGNSGDYTQHVFGDNPLPSDCRFREDIIWLAFGNEKYAQEWKTALEVQQREDRANRNKNRGTH